MEPLQHETLPDGIRGRFIEAVNGLRMHVLEAGNDGADRPAVLLLHGFPELAFSWRKVMLPLAEAGYRVIAPDQRGYGRTTGWQQGYDVDLRPFNMVNLTRDVVALMGTLDVGKAAAVVGHDFGAAVAAYSAVIRPDLFGKVVLMSAPFSGPPAFVSPGDAGAADIHAALAALDPPRKHYQKYYSTPQADRDMRQCPQGVSDFLRGYFHGKSADWPGNDPHPLAAWRAEAIAEMPTYYIMKADQTMAETAADFMPSLEEIAANAWLTDAELAVYAGAFSRTGFQGGLNWYRCRFETALLDELRLFGGRTIDLPACFIAGEKDWGVYQRPGALETMQQRAFTRMTDVHLVSGAGHWVQQEQPEETSRLLLDFLAP
ncbi:MAG: alpha/beta hydrolase [Alphaproteobacteria bacterium]|nr:alpha/beta hydrolase [Alphaproteobacteria bacterium]